MVYHCLLVDSVTAYQQLAEHTQIIKVTGGDCLVGLVIKVPPSRTEDLGLIQAFTVDFIPGRGIPVT